MYTYIHTYIHTYGHLVHQVQDKADGSLDLVKPALPKPLEAAIGAVSALAFTPDSKRVVVARAGGDICIVALDTLTIVDTRRLPPASVAGGASRGVIAKSKGGGGGEARGAAVGGGDRWGGAG